MLQEVFASGVNAVIIPATEQKGFRHLIETVEKDNRLYFGIGIHPENVEDYTPECRSEILEISKHSKCRAIGEIGLEYHYETETKERQKEILRDQLAIASELDLPAIIHSRDADSDTLELLREAYSNNADARTVWHCFSSDCEVAAKAIEMGSYVSFTGNITFKKSQLADVVRMIPNDKIMIETDAPYLAPAPFRGRRNSPKYLHLIAEKISELKDITIDEVIKMTDKNAQTFFRLFAAVLFAFVGLAAGSPSKALATDTNSQEEISDEGDFFERSLFGVGFYVGNNTVVETYDISGNGGEISYDGIITPGFTLATSPFDFLELTLSYGYSKNNKVVEKDPDSGKQLTGPTFHHIFDFQTHWIVNPHNRINFMANLGVNLTNTKTNIYDDAVGGPLENSTNDLGITAGLGLVGNFNIGSGLLETYVAWDILYQFKEFDGVYQDQTEITTFTRYFSIPKIGVIYYFNLYKD